MRLLLFLLAQILVPILTDRPMVNYYCRSLTAPLAASDQTDVAVVFNETQSWLADTSNGGKVTNINDIQFYPSSDCSGTKLDFEVPTWVNTTGKTVAWMRSNISSSSATVISIKYGQASPTNQQNKTGVWSSSVKGAWHLDGSLDLTDSASGNVTMTNNGSASSVTGYLGNGVTFTTGSNQYLTAAVDGSLGTGGNYSQFTVSFWGKPSSAVSVYGMFQWAPTGQPNSSGPSVYGRYNDTSGGQVTLYADPVAYIVAGVAATSDTWHLYTLTFDGSNYHIYVDASEPGSPGAGSWTNANAILAYFGTGFNGYSTMLLDEPRLYNTALTANRVALHYANQSGPYWTIGSEVAH